MKTLILISMLMCMGCSTTKNVETGYAFRQVNITPDTLNNITGLQSGTYVYQFRPDLYLSNPEPVSMLPLAVAIVLGIGAIIGVSARLYEFIKTGK